MPSPSSPRVILIAGPGAAGKTSTAARIAQNAEWAHISEDDYWVEIKTGRPAGELRTAAEQAVVQAQVLRRILVLLRESKNVVLEFILYEDPPLPLLNYQNALSAKAIQFETRILRPSVDEVAQRMRLHGRAGDADVEKRRAEITHQISCLSSPHIERHCVLHTSDLSLEEVYANHFRVMVEGR